MGWRCPRSAIPKPPPKARGVDVFRTKLLIYVVTAAATGMVGALIFLQKARISPDAAFSLIDWTAYVIFIVVIGGIGSMEGPMIGVAIFYLLQYYLAALGSWYLIILGGLAIVLMLFAPSGVWGVIAHTLRHQSVSGASPIDRQIRHHSRAGRQAAEPAMTFLPPAVRIHI